MSSLKSRNRAVMLMLVAIIVIIFAVTLVRVGQHGSAAIATPDTPFGQKRD